MARTFSPFSFLLRVPWSRLLSVCNNVKRLLVETAAENGVKGPVLATCRVTQVYDSGACIYFYFAFNYRGMDLDKAVHVYERIEVELRIILAIRRFGKVE